MIRKSHTIIQFLYLASVWSVCCTEIVQGGTGEAASDAMPMTHRRYFDKWGG